MAYWGLRPVFPPCSSPVPCVSLRHVGAVSHGNLRLLERASSYQAIYSPIMALLDARSVVNKTFLLKDFFTSQNLDFITESWIKVGDLISFFELIPANCKFFNFPRPSGHGGGIVMIVRKCSQFRFSRASKLSFFICIFMARYSSHCLTTVNRS